MVMEPNDVLHSLCGLSVLVISYHGHCTKKEFHPNELSTRRTEWFEGTGTIIGTKRSQAFIITSIHCLGELTSFFVKGEVTNHSQIPATLISNQFIAEDNGIDVAILSCNIKDLSGDIYSKLSTLKWLVPQTFDPGSSLWLVHYPTTVVRAADSADGIVQEGDTVVIPTATYRLHNPVFPIISTGVIIASPRDFEHSTFDSTIVDATAGSSGGIVIDGSGNILGVHDSQHDDNPAYKVLSTHRCTKELMNSLDHIRQLKGLFSCVEQSRKRVRSDDSS